MSIIAANKIVPVQALPRVRPGPAKRRNQPVFNDNGTAEFAGSVIIESGGAVHKSPDAHYWQESVDNSGVLSTSDEGTVSPAVDA